VNQRQRYHHGDLRRALVDAAVERIAQEGVDALSLRAVARDVGVTHAAPYRHFESKAALLAAIAEEGREELGKRAWSAGEATSTQEDKVLKMGAALVRFAYERPGHYKVLFGPYRLSPHLDPTTDPLGDPAVSTMVELWTPVVGAEHARDTALGAWALMHGVANLLVDGRLRPAMLGLADDDLEGMTLRLATAFRTNRTL
jgi:AcrR family transcriptional regulator